MAPPGGRGGMGTPTLPRGPEITNLVQADPRTGTYAYVYLYDGKPRVMVDSRSISADLTTGKGVFSAPRVRKYQRRPPQDSSSCTVKHTPSTRGAGEPNEPSRLPRQLEQRASGRRRPSRTAVARRYRRYANSPGRPSRQRPIPPTRHEVRPGVIAPHHAGAARKVRGEGGKTCTILVFMTAGPQGTTALNERGQKSRS